MSSRQSKYPGLSAKVWRVLLRRPIGETFTAEDLLPDLPALTEVHTRLRAVGAALKHLRTRGGVCVVSFHRIPGGPTCKISHYQRVADELGGSPAEVRLMKVETGVRHVRLLDAVHWHREPSESRPWRGYESGLARIA